MTMTHEVVTLIWVAIVAFVVFMYVLLDGFDLGIGILFPWIRSEKDRNKMMHSIAPVWDGNETWMVLGAACLYGAFPVVYSTVLPTLYLPLMLMLAALILRGVSFEFRFKAEKSKFLWNFSFSLGSTVAAFCQGVVVGTFVQGYSGTYAYGYYNWLTPFSLVAGLAVVAGYALLGSTWLIMKTEGALQRTMFHVAKILMVTVVLFIGIVSLWTPFIDPFIMHRWFSFPNFFFLLPLPLLTLCACGYTVYALYHRYERAPFIMTMLLFLFSYIGLAISAWPYIIPHRVTIWQAASRLNAQVFMLVGVVILLPILIGYTLYSYYVFRGKVDHDEHSY